MKCTLAILLICLVGFCAAQIPAIPPECFSIFFDSTKLAKVAKISEKLKAKCCTDQFKLVYGGDIYIRPAITQYC